jgi:hypothetical protein
LSCADLLAFVADMWALIQENPDVAYRAEVFIQAGHGSMTVLPMAAGLSGEKPVVFCQSEAGCEGCNSGRFFPPSFPRGQEIEC